MASDTAFWEKVQTCTAGLPPAYSQHPVVQRSLPHTAIPLALFVDGVQFATRDTILGIFVVNVATKVRHLVCTLRNSRMCRCGCGGWCSLWPVFNWITWSLKAAGEGMHPSVRHDGVPFSEHSDPARAARAGTPLGFHAALIYLKGDLAEYGHTLGFPTTAHNVNPCFLCRCTKADFVRLEGWDSLTIPWPSKSFADYSDACTRCELWRDITDASVHLQLRGLLAYDNRRGTRAARGLALTEDFPRLMLLKGDRLEPCDTLPDIGSFDALTHFPTKVLFWRRSAETITHHRNPLFAPETGVSPDRAAALDWLHTLSLGVFQTYCSYVIQQLFRIDAWRTLETTEHGRISMSIYRLSAELTAWQREQRSKGRDITEIRHLKPETFGAASSPKFDLKGGETNFMLELLVPILPRFRAGLGDSAAALEDAGGQLLGILALVRRYPVFFPANAIQRFHDHAYRYLSIMIIDIGLPAKPKDHMLIHMADRIRIQGSPALYGNWLDESLNRVLRDIAAGAHSSVHDRRLLSEWQRAVRQRCA